jgi:hypothetical protein
VERRTPSCGRDSAPEQLSDLLKGLNESGHLARLLEVASQITARPPQTGASLAGDILYGADGIAEFLFGDTTQRRKVYNLVETCRLPHFRLGAAICARKSILLEWIHQQEQRKGKGQAAG